MEKLRRLELTDKIKDFYRDNIEKTSLPKQQVDSLITYLFDEISLNLLKLKDFIIRKKRL